MPKKKTPAEIASKALWVRPATRDRVFDLFEVGGETVDDVVCKLLECWDSVHKGDGEGVVDKQTC